MHLRFSSDPPSRYWPGTQFLNVCALMRTSVSTWYSLKHDRTLRTIEIAPKFLKIMQNILLFIEISRALLMSSITVTPDSIFSFNKKGFIVSCERQILQALFQLCPKNYNCLVLILYSSVNQKAKAILKLKKRKRIGWRFSNRVSHSIVQSGDRMQWDQTYGCST